MSHADRNKGRAPWRFRRRLTVATLAFCAGVVVEVLWRGADTSIASAALTNAFVLAGTVIGYYVGGTTWEDARKAAAGSKKGDDA